LNPFRACRLLPHVETINAARLDRIMRGVRIAIGIGALSLTVVGPESPWGYLGIVPLVIGLTGACPVSRLFGRRISLQARSGILAQ